MGGHWQSFVVAALIALALYIFLLYCSYAARAGLILSVAALDKEGTKPKKHSFSQAFKKGQPFSGRLFGLDVLTFLIVLGSIIALCILFAIGFIAGLVAHMWVLTGLLILLGLLLGFIFTLWMFGISLVRILASRGVVLENTGPWLAFKHNAALLRRQWRHILLSFVVLTAILLLLALAIAFIVVLPLVVLGFGSMIAILTLDKIVAVVLAAISGLILVAVLWFIAALQTAFTSSYWTLVYRALHYIDRHVDEATTKSAN